MPDRPPSAEQLAEMFLALECPHPGSPSQAHRCTLCLAQWRHDAERAAAEAVESTVKERIGWAVDAVKGAAREMGKHDTLAALAESLGLEARKCSRNDDWRCEEGWIHGPDGRSECSKCTGTGTLPWTVESLHEAIVKRACVEAIRIVERPGSNLSPAIRMRAALGGKGEGWTT